MPLTLRSALLVAVVVAGSASAASAQATDNNAHEAGHRHGQAEQLAADSAIAQDAAWAYFMAQSSGTSAQPASWPMPMLMKAHGVWQLGLMGQAFPVYTWQSGPRGDDGGYAANWFMGSASRPFGGGRMQFRAMASLEPATVPHRRYPLLFQTGETAYGESIVDGQHPHDFLMELSVQYVRAMNRAGLVNVYYAPVGDVALGPVAYPHRASALELPQATLGHHWQDSTHIASNVLTLGWATGPVRLEGSAFHGSEPDEERWNLDVGAIDSWSIRTSVAPYPNWMGQVSFGHLRQPEALHPDDIDRVTASIHYVSPRADANALATTVIWAMNHKSVARTRTHAVTIEQLMPVGRRDFLSTRFEWSQRDELLEAHEGAHEEAPVANKAFDVSALTLGYTHDVLVGRGVQLGVGGTITRYWPESALTPFYGSSPWGATVFMRVRAKSGGVKDSHRH